MNAVKKLQAIANDKFAQRIEDGEIVRVFYTHTTNADQDFPSFITFVYQPKDYRGVIILTLCKIKGASNYDVFEIESNGGYFETVEKMVECVKTLNTCIKYKD